MSSVGQLTPGREDPERDWLDAAACEGQDLSIFFAPNYFEKQSQKKAREARAKLICRACPVRERCLEQGLEVSEGHGVWGGLNERERRRLVAQRQRIASVAEPMVGTVA